MKVFISSVIKGFEKYRMAARAAVDYVRKTSRVPLEPVMVEKDYPALNFSSQEACLTGVKSCDVYILLLGYRYGWINPQTKLSATHEEYLVAKAANKPMLVFVQSIRKEPAQNTFEAEVSDYITGKFRTAFKNVDGLRLGVQNALEKHISTMGALGNPDKAGKHDVQYVQNVYGNPLNVIQKVETLDMRGHVKRK